MNDHPLVSIVIVNYNGKLHLEKCLKSIVAINYTNYEIILVDNKSSDDSTTFVETNFPNVQIIKLDHNYGFAEPNNIGARKAKGDFLLFLNNDTVVTMNFITELVKIAKQDPQIAIFQSLLLKPDGDIDSAGDYVDILGRAYSSKVKPMSVQNILSARGASMMVQKEKFWDLGGFDKNFFTSFEDVDLGWRSWMCGYKTVVVPDSIVYHIGSQTVKQMASTISFHGVKNTIIIQLTNFEIFYVINSVIQFSFLIILKKFLKISSDKNLDQSNALPSLKTMLKGICWTWRNFRYIVNRRKQINSKRIISTKNLIEMGLIKK